ncbi:MAG TPA: CcdB family protein [Azospirillum sp.]|nr:CcdB family protein [Azospirillum sp.]
MAQFDVHRARGAQRNGVPYVLIVQSKRFDSSGRRVVAPLLDAKLVQVSEAVLTPAFVVEGRNVVLNPLQIVSLPAGQLGDYVCSLESEGDRIIAAIDMLISRAWH